MTTTKNRKIKNKCRKSFVVITILFATLFSGFIPLIELPLGEFNDKPNNKWYNPKLSDFLYQGTVTTNNTFNAYNESYIICKIQNTDYTKFWFNGSQYDVSYGMNTIPVDFGTVNQSYSIDVSQSDVNNEFFDWISVQPLYIDSDVIDVNLESTTDISFEAGGSISILVQPNFSYNWLYLEVDGTIVNNIYNTSSYPELDPVVAISTLSQGVYFQFDLEMNPQQHQLKIKGNGSVDYKIITNYDWDLDSVSDGEEIQKIGFDYRFDPTEAFVFGYFEQGDFFVYSGSSDFLSGLFTFYIPETYKGSGFTSMTIHSGEVKNIVIDENDILYRNQTFETEILNSPITKWLGDLSSGYHMISYDFAGNKSLLVSFSIDGRLIKVLDRMNSLDSDGDGMKNVAEEDLGTDTLNPDSDFDGLYDGYDSSPLSSLVLDNEIIAQIVFPHDSTKNTNIEISIERPENDYYTQDTMIWTDGDQDGGGLEVSIIPMLRLFGNSTINSTELENTWDKELVSYFITDTTSTYGDGVPDDENNNAEVCFIQPTVSNNSFHYAFTYKIGNSAKSDNKIDMRFDVVWTVFWIKQNSSEVIHYYDFDEDIVVQSILKNEVANASYYLANPDCNIENEILWNLIQNSELGTVSEFGVNDDIVGSGSVDYFGLEDQINEDREANPISTDVNGLFNETETLYVSLNFESSDLLYKADVLDEWIIIPDEVKYHGDYEAYYSFYSCSDVLEEQVGVLIPEENIGNFHISYTKAWNNYSTGELGGFEQRYSINQHPIYMNRITTFQNAEILEVSSVFGQTIPLNKLPNSLDEIDYDKLNLINTTTIEKKDDSNGLANIGFDYDNDERKSILDSRLWEVPLSNLIFNRYSFSIAEKIVDALVYIAIYKKDSFIPLFPYIIPNVDFYMGAITPTTYEMFFVAEKSLDIGMGASQGINRGTIDYWNTFFRGTQTGDVQTQGGWTSSYRIAMSDQFDIPIPERIKHCDYVLNWIESDQSTSYWRGEREMRMEDIYAKEGLTPLEKQHYLYDMQMEVDGKVEMSHTMRDELGNKIKRQKEILQQQIRPEMYRKGFVATFQGVSCLITGIMILSQGLFELSNIDYTTMDLLETQLRIVSGVAKLLMASTLLYMSGLYFYKAFWSFKLVEKSIENSITKSGKICLFIGLVIAFIDYGLKIVELDLSEDWFLDWKFWLHTAFFLADVGLLILAYSNPVLGFGLMILVEFIRSIIFYEPPPPIPNPSMAIATEESTITLPTANMKRNGGLEVGDIVNYTLSVYNDGNSMSYLRGNLSAGGDFSSYDGKWEDENGYVVDEEQEINFTRTLSTTSNCLEFKFGIDIDSEIDSTRTPIYEGISKILSNMIVLDSTIGAFYDDLTEWDKPNTYDSLFQDYKKLLESYKHNETAEKLNLLKQRVDYDFLDDSVGTIPSGWTATESEDGVFTTILRPNGDDLDAHKWSYSTGNDYYTEIDEDIVNPSLDVDYPSTLIQWCSSDYYLDGQQYHGNYVKFDFTDFDSISSCVGVKLHFAGDGSNLYDEATKFDISFDDGLNWVEEKPVVIDGNFAWYSLYWSGLDESDLEDFQVKIQCPDLPSFGGDFANIEVLYAEIFYTKSSIADTSLVSDYLNHNNIVNISLYGEQPSRSFTRDFGSSKTSGTIEFWMCKDNFTYVEIDSFFRINQMGDIIKYGTDTLIRPVQVEIDLWNNFKIDYTSSQFDLYLNGIKIGNDISYSDSDATEFNFTVSHDFQRDDMSKFNVSATYFDAIDFSWSSGYYDGRSFCWDYSLENITKYETLYDNLLINTSISTDLSENIVEMSTTTNIAEFVFDLDLVGIEDPNINITLFNIPTGFTANATEIFQPLQDTINFKITDTGTLDYSGVYYIEMNITLSDNDTVIYYEKIPFRIPLIEDLDFDQFNIIYDATNIEGNSTIIEDIPSTQISKGDVVKIEFKTDTYSEVLINFVNNDVIAGTYSLMSSGNNYGGYQISSIVVDESITFDEISFDVIRYNYFNISKISISNANSVVGQNFNPINITNNGNIPEFISFDFTGFPFTNIDQTGYEEEFYIETQIVRVLPDETRQMNFDITIPTESISNLLWRGIDYFESGSGNLYNSYIDNLEFDGIYIASPTNKTYNIIGNNSLCGKSELLLDIIPEESLEWSAYSFNSGVNITFTETANITIPNTNGMYSIQVFGNNSVGTMFESEIRYFSVNYPITLYSPFNTTYYNTNHTLDLNISVSTWSIFSDFEYSLCNTPRKSITSNSTTLEYIPYGSRTIEVFGKDSYGDEYSSGLIRFDVALERQTPSQPDCFTFTNGTLLTPYGDLTYIDGNYSTITYTDANIIPYGFISSITGIQGTPSGSLSDTQTDDSNYYRVNARRTRIPYTGEYVYDLDVTFNVNPTYAGNDFYFSCHIASTTSSMVLKKNGGTIASGSVIDIDNMLLTDVTSITMKANRLSSAYNSKIYYFKLEDTMIVPAVLNFTTDLSVDDPNLHEVEYLKYSHKTNASAVMNLDIWDWNSNQWDVVESVNNYATFDDDYIVLGNESNYLNSTNGVRIRFQASENVEYQLEIDVLKLWYSTDLVPDNLYESPIQPDNFTFTNGTLLSPYGDLKYIDGNFSNFYGSWIVAEGHPQYINSITLVQAISSTGTIPNTYVDNSAYKKYLSKQAGPYKKLRIAFNIDPAYAGRDFYFSYHSYTDLTAGGRLYVNGVAYGSSKKTHDFNDVLFNDVTSITWETARTFNDHYLKVYYFKLVPVGEVLDLDFQVDLQIDDEDCYFPNSISYSFKTNVSATIDFDIWNWKTETWYEIESVNNYATFDYDLFILDLGCAYVNSTNGVRLRFQSFDNPTDFQLEIDQLRLDYYAIDSS